MKRCVPMSGYEANVLRRMVADHYAATGGLSDLHHFLEEHPTHASLLEIPPDLSARERWNIVDAVEQMHTDLPRGFTIGGWSKLKAWLLRGACTDPFRDDYQTVSLQDIPKNSTFKAPRRKDE